MGLGYVRAFTGWTLLALFFYRLDMTHVCSTLQLTYYYQAIVTVSCLYKWLFPPVWFTPISHQSVHVPLSTAVQCSDSLWTRFCGLTVHMLLICRENHYLQHHLWCTWESLRWDWDNWDNSYSSDIIISFYLIVHISLTVVYQIQSHGLGAYCFTLNCSSSLFIL